MVGGFNRFQENGGAGQSCLLGVSLKWSQVGLANRPVREVLCWGGALLGVF